MSVNGGIRKVRSQAWLLAVVAVATGGVAWATRQGWAAVILTGVGVFLPVADLLIGGKRAQADDIDLEKVADRLALAVRKQWADEAKRREITSPPLAVSWRPASPSLVQPWSYLQQLTADGAGWPTPTATAAGPQGLAGSGPQILAAYDRTPCGRLVVLGEPGAGKTVLLIRLVLDLLARRQPGEPVPLLVPLASWNPDGPSLTDWLEAQILRTYPQLTGAISAGGRSRARALLDDGLILPVLDGLDEIRGGSRAQALTEINATLPNHTGVIVSSRAKAFRRAVRLRPGVGPTRLEGAAGIRLAPLSPTVVADYLIATAGDGGRDRWSAVLTAMSSPGTPLARAMTTPLMAGLARTVYNPRGGESNLGLPDPGDLIALPTVAAVEQHLLAGFVPAAYRVHPNLTRHWSAEQASSYLTFLAHHLESRLCTTSLAWWELAGSTPRPYRALALGLVSGLAGGLVIGLAAGLSFGLTDGLAGGLFGWIVGGIAGTLLGRPGDARPSQISLRRPRRDDFVVGFTAGIMGGVAGGVVFGLMVGLVAGSENGIVAGLGNGLLSGLVIGFVGGPVFGLVVGLSAGLAGGLGADVDLRAAAEPIGLLRYDRRSALVFGLAGGLAFAFAGALAFGLALGILGGALVGLVFGTIAGLAFGLTFALVGGLVGGATSAWGQLALARPWLTVRRQMPLRLIAFLEDAHGRGVLRQAGAVWEFRHANLQRYLANRP